MTFASFGGTPANVEQCELTEGPFADGHFPASSSMVGRIRSIREWMNAPQGVVAWRREALKGVTAMAFYEGTPSKDGGGGDVRVSDDARVRVPLEHHIHHSPDGYAWGYTGSGPAELARCILWDHLGYEPHVLLYQLFKADVVAKWDGNDSWELRSGDIDDWLERNRSVPLLRETKGVSRRKSPLLSVLRF